MNFFSAFLEMFRNSDQFIAHMSAEYGIYVYLFLFTVYFLETGIVICALLPGDSLIFVSGAASAAGILNPLGAFLAIALGACFGNTVAYGIGYFLGSKIYDGSIKWIDQQQMAKTQAFFAKHGKLTIVLARFVPIIRSFAPLVADLILKSAVRSEPFFGQELSLPPVTFLGIFPSLRTTFLSFLSAESFLGWLLLLSVTLSKSGDNIRMRNS